MPNPFLAQCSLIYPYPPHPNQTNPTIPPTISPGEPLSFAVIVPPASATFPLVGSHVTWTLTRTDPKDPADPNDVDAEVPLEPGVDYQILRGGLEETQLSVVFRPLSRIVSVSPTLTLFYLDNGTNLVIPAVSSPTDPPQFAPKSYVTTALAAAENGAALATLLRKNIRLVAAKTIIDPGDAAALKLLPQPVPAVPQVLTSIVDEAPSVEIRGAVPLKSLVEAIIGPLTGALGHVLPSSRTSLEEVGGAVQRLLGEPLSIPLAIDVLGKRISRTLAPIGEPVLPVFTTTPEQTNALEGLVPVGQWGARFFVSKVQWKTQRWKGLESDPWPDPVAVEDDPSLESGLWDAARVVGEDPESADLAPGLHFLKSLLLRPQFADLSDPFTTVSPRPIRVLATMTVTIDDIGDVTVNVPPIVLTLLPLPLPRVAVLFRKKFGYRGNDQDVFVAVDRQSATVVSGLDDCLRLLTRLTTALNNIAAVANALGADWRDLIEIGQALSVLSDELGRVPPSRIIFAAQWRDPLPIEMSEDGRTSAVIYIGVPGRGRCILRHLPDLAGQEGPRITFGGTNATAFSSIIPVLDGRFSELVQVPEGSARASDPAFNYDNNAAVLVPRQLDTVEFTTSCAVSTLLAPTDLAGALPEVRNFVDEDLSATAAGRWVERVVGEHAAELIRLVDEHDDLRASALAIADRLMPLVHSRRERRPAVVDRQLKKAIDTALERLSGRASGLLAADIARGRELLVHFSGRSLLEGLTRAEAASRRGKAPWLSRRQSQQPGPDDD